MDLDLHAYALDVSGYTVVPGQVGADELSELREAADAALAAARAVVATGRKLEGTYFTEAYEAARCLYCWGEACVRLLEHETIHALAARMMGEGYRLWDLTALSVLPLRPGAKEPTTGWHRDFGGPSGGGGVPGHLWFFVCLDAMTSDNGATWVIPGSHRPPSCPGTAEPRHLAACPSRVQLIAEAGDLVALNPSIFHDSGVNRTSRPRRLINVGVSHAQMLPLLDHWTIAGPQLRARAGPRLRGFLSADYRPLAPHWTVLPPGWQTADIALAKESVA